MEAKRAFLIPVYNHYAKLEKLVQVLEPFGLYCLLVNDGSMAECRAEMERIVGQYDWLNMISLDQNQGKGGAVIAGINALFAEGYTHAFQIDADSQHDLSQIQRFLDESAANPNAMILGQAQYDESVPKGRLYGRYITHVWVWIETLSLQVKDSMCGFRIYPIAATHQVINKVELGKRMEFDVEVIVRLFWAGVPAINSPVHVNYPEDGISHFDILNDNLRLSKAHAKLFFGMLLRFPVLLFRSLLWTK